MENRIAIAKFINGDKIAHTESIWQYDYGQELKLEGLDLPSAFEVHFAKELHGNAVTSLYNSGSALIPDQLIQTPGTLFAWVYLHDTESDGETEYTIVIDVKKRAKPSHETPTPAQQSEIEQLIATLETAVEQSETNVTHYPKIEDGYWYVWDAGLDDWVNTEIPATGPQGPEGPEGPEGPQGPDGYSPSASVSKSGATATITITDKDGTTTASISDGAALIDDTTTAQDSTWSSSKIDNTKMDKNNPTGSGSLSVGRQAGSTVGWGSVALGSGSAQATETNSFAFGYDAEALARHAVAMGYDCSASEMGSFALGYHVSAQGRSSHAEGEISVAFGDYSHAEGYSSLARGDYQHVGGKFNLEDTTSVEIIGNGTDNLNRSNARTLDWNGNEKLAGKLTIGSDPTADMDVVPRKYMEQAIQDAVLSILPKKTVTGAVVSFSDAQPNLPLVDLTAQIVPNQSGTGDPSPSNIRPISGFTGVNVVRCGKNLFDKSTMTEDKYIKQDGTEGSSAGKAHSVLLPIKPSTTYYMSGYCGNSYYTLLALDADKQPLANWYGGASKTAPFTATTPANASYMWLNFNADQKDTVIFCESASAVPYEPYNGQTYSVTWQTEAGTVYGGSIDLTTGVLTVTHGLFDLGDLTYSYGQDNVFSANIDEMKTGNIEIYCDKLIVNTTSFAWNQTPTMLNLSISRNSSNYSIYVKNTDYTNPSDLKTALQGFHICVPIATPQTYQLTPKEVKTLLGVTNIFSDTGNSSVTYGAKIT